MYVLQPLLPIFIVGPHVTTLAEHPSSEMFSTTAIADYLLRVVGCGTYVPTKLLVREQIISPFKMYLIRSDCIFVLHYFILVMKSDSIKAAMKCKI